MSDELVRVKLSGPDPETAGRVRAHILEIALLDEDELDDAGSFLDGGIIDSTGMLELVAWVQEAFDVRIDDWELVPENLDSVDNLTAFIADKKNAPPPTT